MGSYNTSLLASPVQFPEMPFESDGNSGFLWSDGCQPWPPGQRPLVIVHERVIIVGDIEAVHLSSAVLFEVIPLI